MDTPGKNYALGAVLIVVCAASFAFLSGSTAVFVGIAGAIGGAVLILRGIQLADAQSDPSLQDPMLQDPLNFDDGYDWDAEFRRNTEGGR
ncbi:hypothetical protein V6D40_08900 [Corynebacterium sp. Q4381]|uniref:hypothetical protein n=1 Tax=Corynebacterium sp. Marseille-Q4381 TaxID=3121597 RepID=UPI002FE58664